jgi:type III restriction enzyme
VDVSIKFISDLPYQREAIDSVVGLFDGVFAQTIDRYYYEITPNPEIISLDLLNKNLEKIQTKNNLKIKKISSIDGDGLYDRPNFSIEMETGTGKTYIFLRTVLDLNTRFGLKKFIIVVPSVAIREGILANLKLTIPHFQQIYGRTPYEFRVFSSDRLTDLSTFCRSNILEIMVITIQSFNKEDINTLYEKGRDDILIADSGIEMLARTKPVLILDEPHKMSSELSASALNHLNPLFILRYSATHTDLEKSNLIYSLTPLDAHNLGLVKKIDVIGASMRNEASLPLIRLLGVVLKPKIKAKVLLKTKTAKGVSEKPIMLSKSESLHEKTKNPAYQDLIVTNISGEEGNTYIELTGGIKIKLNESKGDTYIQVAKEQIENTVRTHFEKQEKLKQHGVKVLSLFFVDEVTDYQEIDPSKAGGIEELARIDQQKYLFVRKAFDEAFNRLKKEYPEWKDKEPENVRGAYFSARKTFKSISQDKEKIDEILRDKEKLLSFDSPTCFIFTHSALGEGWDNPNVYNICTLRITHSEITKRQTIGRGLRIPVNQGGTRFENLSENMLTVVANESYEDFARSLQNDYAVDGVIHVPPIENRRNQIISKLRPDVFNGEFKDIWGKLKVKTDFQSEIHTDELIRVCKEAIKENLIVKKPIIDIRRAKLEFTIDGIETLEQESEPIKQVQITYSIPDAITRISNETGLTRKTIAQILLESDRLNDIFNNPEEFISGAITIIKDKRIKMEIKTAKYYRTNMMYPDTIFESEVSSYKTNVVDTSRSVYDKVICDNPSEQQFAKDLTGDEQVNVFCKLPQKYYVGTPTGNYRPDWAIIYQRKRIAGNIEHKLYLVRETKFGYSAIKGTKKSIPQDEQDKIDCALRHFNEVGGLDFKTVMNYDDFRLTLISQLRL